MGCDKAFVEASRREAFGSHVRGRMRIGTEIVVRYASSSGRGSVLVRTGSEPNQTTKPKRSLSIVEGKEDDMVPGLGSVYTLHYIECKC